LGQSGPIGLAPGLIHAQGKGQTRPLVPPEDSAAAHWFRAELQPHEPMLRAWLRSQFPAGTDLDDIVQESFLRVLRAWEKGEVRSPKALLFVTARNLMLMQFRHRQVAKEEALMDMELAGIMDEGTDVAEAVARSQELELLTLAIQSLPTRCRQILTLRKIYGLSQKEVAAELGISENTVESQGTIALRKLGEFFARHDALPPS
jgi:RNA polymerase sigma factor (sigma-70 family)